jgi:glycosyltransferase involved in cell wall biosynthesis
MEGVNGHRVPAGDVEALSQAMTSILADPDRAREMGMQSARIVERFSPEGVAEALHRSAELALRLPL